MVCFPLTNTYHFLPFLTIWANLKMVFLRYEFFKNNEVFPITDFTVFPVGGIRQSRSRQKCIFGYLFEALWAWYIKNKQTSRKRSKKIKKSEKLKEGAILNCWNFVKLNNNFWYRNRICLKIFSQFWSFKECKKKYSPLKATLYCRNVFTK